MGWSQWGHYQQKPAVEIVADDHIQSKKEKDKWKQRGIEASGSGCFDNPVRPLSVRPQRRGEKIYEIYIQCEIVSPLLCGAMIFHVCCP